MILIIVFLFFILIPNIDSKHIQEVFTSFVRDAFKLVVTGSRRFFASDAREDDECIRQRLATEEDQR